MPISTTTLCVRYGFCVRTQTGTPIAPAAMLASEKASVESMRVEDVGVEDAERIRGERVGDPRHDPDTPAAIVGVDAADRVDAERQRVGQHDRERQCGEHDERRARRARADGRSRTVMVA